jgi:hypothetical protein
VPFGSARLHYARYEAASQDSETSGGALIARAQATWGIVVKTVPAHWRRPETARYEVHRLADAIAREAARFDAPERVRWPKTDTLWHSFKSTLVADGVSLDGRSLS